MELDEVGHYKCKTQVKEESGDYYLVIAKIGMSGLGKESGRKAWLENWNRWLRQHGKACGKIRVVVSTYKAVDPWICFLAGSLKIEYTQSAVDKPKSTKMSKTYEEAIKGPEEYLATN